MRKVTMKVALAGAGLLLACAVPVAVGSATPAAAAGTVPTIASLSVSPTTVAASGLTPATVTVSIRLTSAVALSPSCTLNDGGQPGSAGAFIMLTRTTPADPRVGSLVPARTAHALNLTSGSGTDGSWTAQIAVPSTWVGTWRVATVFACRPNDVTSESVDPDTVGHGGAFTVTGTELPALSMGYRPNPVPWNASTVRVQGRLVNGETGAPLARRRLDWCRDTGCGIDGGYTSTVVITDDAGYYRYTLGVSPLFSSLQVWTTPVPATWFGTQRVSLVLSRGPQPVTAPAVSVTPSAAVVATGSRPQVSGRFFDAGRCWSATDRHPVLVEYLVGRTAWRPLVRTTTRLNGRWQAMVPARAERWVLRARYPGTSGAGDGSGACAGATSRSFALTGV